MQSDWVESHRRELLVKTANNLSVENNVPQIDYKYCCYGPGVAAKQKNCAKATFKTAWNVVIHAGSKHGVMYVNICFDSVQFKCTYAFYKIYLVEICVDTFIRLLGSNFKMVLKI